MKTRFLATLLLVFVVTEQTNAQIENEIKSYVDSTEILINNGRRLLLQKIQEKNIPKATEIYNYLLTKADSKNCTPFNYTEELYLSCFFSEWQHFLSKAENIKRDNQTLCYQNSFEILNLLYKELSNSTQLFQEIIAKTDLNNEEKDLFEIYLYYMKTGVRDDEYDSKIKTFHRNYPKSRFKDFFSLYMPSPSMKGGMTYSFGAAEIFPSGNLSQYFSPVTAFSMSMDFNFNKFYMSMYINGGVAKLIKPFTATNSLYNYSFGVMDRFSYFDGGFNFGYYLLRNKYLHIVPYVNLGGGYIESNLYNDSDDDDKEFSAFDSFIVGPGIHSELKLFDYKVRTIYLQSNQSEPLGYFSLRLDAGYNIVTKNDYTQFKGNLSYIKMAIVWGIGIF